MGYPGYAICSAIGLLAIHASLCPSNFSFRDQRWFVFFSRVDVLALPTDTHTHAQIHFFVMLNKQGKVRLSKWYAHKNEKLNRSNELKRTDGTRCFRKRNEAKLCATWANKCSTAIRACATSWSGKTRRSLLLIDICCCCCCCCCSLL